MPVPGPGNFRLARALVGYGRCRMDAAYRLNLLAIGMAFAFVGHVLLRVF